MLDRLSARFVACVVEVLVCRTRPDMLQKYKFFGIRSLVGPESGEMPPNDPMCWEAFLPKLGTDQLLLPRMKFRVDFPEILPVHM